MACYHIIARHASMHTGPALKRCFRNRKTAETVKARAQLVIVRIITLTLARR